MAIQDSHRFFYHVDKIVACLSGDRQMIGGLQFGIGGYERGDFEQLSIQRPETAGIVDP